MACHLRREYAGDHPRPDQKHLVLAHFTETVEHILEQIKPCQTVSDPLFHHIPMRNGIKKSRINHRIQNMRAIGNNLGQSRCRPEQIRKQTQNRFMRFENGKQFDRCGHGPQSAVKGCKRRIGVRCDTEGFEQSGHKFCQHFTRARTGHSLSASEMPAAHRLCHQMRIGITHQTQSIERIRIINRSCKHQTAFAGCQLRALFEQTRIMIFDLQSLFGERLAKGCNRRKSAKLRKGQQPVIINRQALGLFVLAHLQPVFERPQKPIGL